MDAKELLKKYEPAKDGTTIAGEPQVRAARYSPCGKMIVAGGFDARVRRWNVAGDETVELPALEGHHGWIDGLAFRAEGELLFTGDSWGRLCCWRGYAADQPAMQWQHEAAH